MENRIKVEDLPEFDTARHLENEVAVVSYLADILDSNNATLLASALSDIFRAHGISEISETAAITRKALYEALGTSKSSRTEKISRVCAALGIRLAENTEKSQGCMKK